MPRKYQNIHIRIPRDTYEAARANADEEHRSLNGQIVVLIERGLPPGLRERYADAIDHGEPFEAGVLG